MISFVVAERRITQADCREELKINECRLKVTPAEKSYVSSSLDIVAILATLNAEKLNIVDLFIVMWCRAVIQDSF
jgi:hypothetical protein